MMTMADETTIEDLRAELDRQREGQEARHKALLDHLTERRPLTQARASRTMEAGYAAEAERREQDAAGEGDGEAA
jgi:hypothetical protein